MAQQYSYIGSTLTVDDEAVEIRYMGGRTTRIPRGELAQVQAKVVAKPVWGMKGDYRLTFVGASGAKIVFKTNDVAAFEALSAEFAELPPVVVPVPSAVEPAPVAAIASTLVVAPASVAAGPQTVVREYGSSKEFEHGIADMAAQGYHLVGSPTVYQPRAGVGRMLALGPVGAAVIKPKQKILATFSR